MCGGFVRVVTGFQHVALLVVDVGLLRRGRGLGGYLGGCCVWWLVLVCGVVVVGFGVAVVVCIGGIGLGQFGLVGLRLAPI